MQMVRYKLSNNYGVSRIHTDRLTMQGSCFWNDRLLSEEDEEQIIHLLRQNRVHEFNGFYAIYVFDDPDVYCFCDPMRSYPIFYSYFKEELYISDNPYWIAQETNDRLDGKKTEDYKLALFTFGDKTLFSSVKQLRAGEMLHYREGNLSVRKTCCSDERNYRNRSYSAFLREHEAALDQAFMRLIRFAEGRRIVIPLSGGYDSRLVACMLKKLNYESVTAFTYGDPDGAEVRLSREVARLLHFDWLYIEAEKEDCEQARDTEEFLAFFSYAGKAVSVPHLQDWICIKKMRENRWIPEDSVIVPGHAGDVLSGECSDRKGWLYYDKTGERNIKKAAQAVVDYLFTEKFLSRGEKRYYEACVAQEMERLSGAPDTASLYESWWLCERTSKFIVNSVRTYEFFGYQWWLPLADHEYADFWSGVPLLYRADQRIYCDTVKELMARVLHKALPREGEASGHFNRIKKLASRYCSINARNQLKRILRKPNEMRREYESGPGLMWHYFIHNSDEYIDFKQKNNTSNYAAGEYYLTHFDDFMRAEREEEP